MHGYNTKRLIYSPTLKPDGHIITLYWIKDKIYYSNTKLVDAQIYGSFNNIQEVLKQEVKRCLILINYHLIINFVL